MKAIQELYQFSELIHRDLVIRVRRGNTYTVCFEECGISHNHHDTALTYVEGRGHSIYAALINYIERIQGKMLVDFHNPYLIMEYKVPDFIKEDHHEGQS